MLWNTCPRMLLDLEHDMKVRAWMLRSPSALETHVSLRLGQDAEANVCSWNPNIIMIIAWMPWRTACFGKCCLGMDVLEPHALGTKTLAMVWAYMPWSQRALETRTSLWFGRGCPGHGVLLKHKRLYVLGMDAAIKPQTQNL